MGAKPQGPVKSINFRGFQAPTGAEPPPSGKRKKFKPPLDKFLNTPLIFTTGLFIAEGFFQNKPKTSLGRT